MKSTLISIIIPCFNGEHFIDQCLESVTNQSYKNMEILIMNDGSTDNSLHVLRKWERKDSRVKVFSRENRGLSNSRNELIKISKGTYFTLLDIDDTFKSNSIELLYDNSFNGKADIVVGRTNGVYRNGQVKLPYFPVWRRRKNMTNFQYVKSNICTPWSSIIRRKFYDELNIQFLPNRVFEDIGLMPYIYLKSKTFVAINDITYNYHKYKSDSISNFKKNSFLKRNDLIANTNTIFERFKIEGWENEKEYRRAINGILFVVLLLNDILVHNFTNDLKIRKLLRHNFFNLLDSFGWRIKLIKTPWKFLCFFYLKMTYIKNNKNGSIFLKTFKKNYIYPTDEKNFFMKNQMKIFEFNKSMLNQKFQGSRNAVLEIRENDFIKYHKFVNLIKSQYILINVKDVNFPKFTNYLSHENINGVIINSKVFDVKHFKDNENFLIVCIEYNHFDETSLKRLCTQLSELNNILRRPLIFLKCQKDKRIINVTKKLIDSFIFVNTN
ncbi:MAG: glycosyltransferase family 2 protein [Metamycoplasmataceae bacterium]